MDMSKLDPNMAVKIPGDKFIWYNAEQLNIEGKGWSQTEEFYDRLPAKSNGVVRPEVWNLSKCSAGICVRFDSDCTALSVKWESLHAMNHMPATGVSGVDLYVKANGKWRWLAVGRPVEKVNSQLMFENLSAEKREYRLYMPLYAPVKNVEIGIPEEASISPGKVMDKLPIVFYGTSITQGGCASRPGMAHPAIVGRKLDYPVINLGFSGNGKMEPEVIDLLLELDASCYIIDCLPNLDPNDPGLPELLESGVRKLRSAVSEVPIVLVDNIKYTNADLVPEIYASWKKKNEIQFAVYEKLKAEGMTDLYYLRDDALIGDDGEGTVDGTHPTDVGFIRFAEKFVDFLKPIL